MKQYSIKKRPKDRDSLFLRSISTELIKENQGFLYIVSSRF